MPPRLLARLPLVLTALPPSMVVVGEDAALLCRVVAVADVPRPPAAVSASAFFEFRAMLLLEARL